MNTDTKRCGAIHPKKSTEVCARDAGHVGMHTNGGNVTWKQAKPDDAKEPSLVDKCGKCDRELGEHDGKKCPPKAAVDQWGQNIAETPEEKLNAVFGGPATEPAKSRKRHEEPQIRVHPAADALPMIEGPEFEALVEDIRINGQRHRCVLDCTGEWLVDGRNRKRACDLLGMAPAYERLPEGANIAAYVISTNLKRRHLNESQRAMIASAIANLSQGQKKKTRPEGGFEEGVTQAEAAVGAGVGERTVQRANAVRDKGVPELVDAVVKGKVDLKGAEQVSKLSPKQQRDLIKERIDTSKGPVRAGKLAALSRQETKREIVRNINTGKVAPMPAGLFGVIYADYPWFYDNSDQHEGSRGHMDYPGMKMPEILAHAREAGTRMGKDCVLALWVTNLYIEHIGDVVRAYGATHHTMWTWPKPKAGVGSWARGQTEHLVIASIGNPTHTLNEVSTLLPAYGVREPGRKPDEVAALLRKHCAGPFLELFAREPREGFTCWGAEVQKFAGAA